MTGIVIPRKGAEVLTESIRFAQDLRAIGMEAHLLKAGSAPPPNAHIQQVHAYSKENPLDVYLFEGTVKIVPQVKEPYRFEQALPSRLSEQRAWRLYVHGLSRLQQAATLVRTESGTLIAYLNIVQIKIDSDITDIDAFAEHVFRYLTNRYSPQTELGL